MAQNAWSVRSQWELEISDIITLLTETTSPFSQISNGPKLLSITANWGPPISGRRDTDFLNIWAAAYNQPAPSPAITLYAPDTYTGGTHNRGWNDIATFEKVEAFDKIAIYHLSTQPVREFVLRSRDADGNFQYDNNGGFGINYRILPYVGMQVTHLRSPCTIHDLTNKREYNWIICLRGMFRIYGDSGLAFMERIETA